MKQLPFEASDTCQLGIRQVEQEYQHRYVSRVQSVRVSGVALLLAIGIHGALTAVLIGRLIEHSSSSAAEHVTSYLGATACALPVTYVLARLYMRSLMRARQARARLLELETLRVRARRKPGC